MARHTYEFTPVVKYKHKKVKMIRVPSLSADERFYQVVCEWNKKKSLKTFVELYKHGFTKFSFKDIFGWRVYRIIKNTITGKYKTIELEKQ